MSATWKPTDMNAGPPLVGPGPVLRPSLPKGSRRGVGGGGRGEILAHLSFFVSPSANLCSLLRRLVVVSPLSPSPGHRRGFRAAADVRRGTVRSRSSGHWKTAGICRLRQLCQPTAGPSSLRRTEELGPISCRDEGPRVSTVAAVPQARVEGGSREGGRRGSLLHLYAGPLAWPPCVLFF